MPRDYLHEGAYKLAVELRTIEKQLQEPNKSYVLGYKRFLELNNRKEKTIVRRLQELRSILKEFKKDAKKVTKEDIESIALWINKSERASISKDKMRLTLKNFYKWLYQSDEYPDLVRWIKLSNAETKKLPAEVLLTEEDIAKLIEACKNQRDKALIALLWDTGMRIGELLTLRIQDLTFQKEGMSYVRLSGKTGDRRTPIIFSTPYLVNYLNDVRKHANPEDRLFVIINHGTITNNPMDYPSIRKILKQLKERSQITKRVYPHLFRHSRATFYANSLTEQQLKAVFGWSGASKMAAVYVHLSGKDVDNAVLKANGIEHSYEAHKPSLTIKTCPKCREVNEATAKYCVRCGSPLDLNAIAEQLDVYVVKKELDSLKSALTLLMSKLDSDTQKKILDVVKT